MKHDRITAIRVKGLRSLDDVELTLSDLTVLIGQNGAGKSSLVEACELLSKAGSDPTFLDKLASVHGGGRSLVRRGLGGFTLEVDLDGAAGRLRYHIAFVYLEPYLTVVAEVLTRPLDDAHRFSLLAIRNGGTYNVTPQGDLFPEGEARPIAPHELMLHAPIESQLTISAELARMRRVLAGIEVHTALDVRPRWTAPNEPSARSANVVQGVRRLALGGKNLSNALVQLRQQRSFARVLEDIRLGLGDDIDDLVLQPMASGGEIAVEVRLRGGWDLPLFALSDGQIAYLAQVVIAHLDRPQPPSLVVLDEPDLHFHPGLAVRLAQMIEGAAERFPVLVATQSDAFLDALSEPAQSAVLCELDGQRATRLTRPDPDTLATWLQEYGGLGGLRRSGYDQLVFREPESRVAGGT